jgi:hypothetical protein
MLWLLSDDDDDDAERAPMPSTTGKATKTAPASSTAQVRSYYNSLPLASLQ